MRPSIAILAVMAALTPTVPAPATSTPVLALTGDVPLTPLGLSFTPESPQPVPPGHPLYHHVTVDPVADMPSVVGASVTSGFIGAAKRSSFDKALRETLDKLNMLAPTDAEAKFRLSTHWQGLDAPFKISFSSQATARLSYMLTRIDNGQRIFERQIATSADAHGGEGGARAIGVGRLAIMTNLASVALCLDKAAYGHAPEDCALTPGFTFRPPRPPIILFIPR